MSTKLSANDQFLVFLDDAETNTLAGDSCAVIRGHWKDPDLIDGEIWVSNDGALGAGAKEVLVLNEDNLLTIRQKLPELWESWTEL